MLFVAAAVWGAQDARMGHWKLSVNLHQEDSYFRMARAIDAQIGVLMVDAMAFLGMSLSEVYVTHKRKRTQVQIGGGVNQQPP